MQYYTNDQLARYAPAVAATEAHDSRSKRYGFLNTLSIVDALRDAGWFPVDYQIGNPRSVKGREFGKHMLRFRQDNGIAFERDALIPEVVLFNAHDGTSAYRFMAGIFRVLCSNGLIVADSMFGDIRVIHTRNAIKQAVEATDTILDAVPGIMGRVDAWKLVELSQSGKLEFANEAAKLRPGVLQPVASELLRPRRFRDEGQDLWRTFNVVQENLIKGGTYGRKTETVQINGVNRDVVTEQRLRAIKGPKELIQVNRDLWDLADQFAKAA